MQWHTQFEVCVTSGCGASGYLQNFSPIERVVFEIRKRGVHVRTCSDTPSLRCVSLAAVGCLANTKFQPNRTGNFWDTKKGCARAHVQGHPKLEVCVSSNYGVPDHIPILNSIGPAVLEILPDNLHKQPPRATCKPSPATPNCSSARFLWIPMNAPIEQWRPHGRRCSCYREILLYF